MGENAAMAVQYRVIGAIIDESVTVLQKTAFMAGVNLASSLSSLCSKFRENGMPIASNSIKDNAKYINMLKPLEMPEPFMAKLKIDSEFGELFGEDKHIKYALSSIFNIIDEALGDSGFHYSINIKLRDKGNRHGWERVDLVIKFPDEHYGEITGYWKTISANVRDFYKSLQGHPAFSEDRIEKISKFVYIVVRSEDW